MTNRCSGRSGFVGSTLVGAVLALAIVGAPVAAATIARISSVSVGGVWKSSSYQCPAGVHHTEEIRVVQHGTSVVATKITGDQCVPAGHITFEGTLHGNSGAVSIYVSSPGASPTLRGGCTTLKVLTRTKMEETGSCFAEGILVFHKL